METTPSTFQAIAALLLVLGLIYAAAWLLKKFSFGGTPLASFGRPRADKQLQLVETLWLDARYRLVIVADRGLRRTLLLGPQQATELTSAASRPDYTHATPSNLPAS